MQYDNLYVLYCRVVVAAADLNVYVYVNVYVNAAAVDDSVDDSVDDDSVDDPEDAEEDCCYYLRSGYNLLLRFDKNSVRVRDDQQFLDSRQHYYHHCHRHHAAAAGSGDFHRYYLGLVGYSYLINRIESNRMYRIIWIRKKDSDRQQGATRN